MKKLITLICLFTFIIWLPACSSADTAPKTDAPAIPEPMVQNQKNDAVPTTAEFDFQEVTVLDNEHCTIRITGIDPNNMWGYTLKAFFENKSPDKTYIFSVSSASINGLQTDPFFGTEIAPGKKANEEISFIDETLYSENLDSFTDIELAFHVTDPNDWESPPVAEASTHIYPLGEESATTFQRKALATDTILVDNDYATVIVTGYDPSNLWGYTANLFIVNKTTHNLMVSIDEVSVNGYMADPFYGTIVNAEKCTFSSISWPETEFETNGITNVENIEFRLHIHDADDWMLDDYTNEPIVLTP